MIDPQHQIQEDVYIRAASGAVWRTFSRVSQWQAWYPRVVETKWINGEAWAEGAIMQVRVKNRLGTEMQSQGVVRMAVPDNTAVWENTLSGLVTICTAQVEDEGGGSLFTLKKAYHGPLAIAMPLIKGSQQRQLAQALQNLKDLVEGLPR